MIQMRAKAQADAIKIIADSLNSDVAKEAATLALAKEVCVCMYVCDSYAGGERSVAGAVLDFSSMVWCDLESEAIGVPPDLDTLTCLVALHLPLLQRG